MKKQLLSLLVWIAVFYFIFGPIRNWGETGYVSYVYVPFVTFKGFVLFSSSLMAFMAYSVASYLIFYCTYPKKRYSLGITLLLISIPLVIGFRYVLQEIVMKAIFGFGNYTDGYLLRDYFFDNLYYAFVFTGLGLIVYFLRYTRYKEQQQRNFEIENQKTQLSLLRSQINPHFLFNALNNIYALVYEKSDASLGALEKLSRLLRYSLYEKSELVPLEKEWRFIENYIELEQLRLSFHPVLLLDVPAILPKVKILPFSLITFVENAFKHGDLRNIVVPLRIQIKTDSTYFIFKIENSIIQKVKDQTGGIGLDNIQRRLSLFYQDQHQLNIKNNSDQFSVLFKIPLALCSNV